MEINGLRLQLLYPWFVSPRTNSFLPDAILPSFQMFSAFNFQSAQTW